MSKQSQSNQKSRGSNLTLGAILAAIVLVFSILTELFGGAPPETATVTPVPATDAAVTSTQTPVSPDTPGATEIAMASSPFEVHFSQPTGSRDAATYHDGTDTVLAASLDTAMRTIDIAAFELNSPSIADALLAAHARGVTIRVVTDDDHGLDVDLYVEYLEADEDEKEDLADEMESPPDETLLDELYDAGIPIVDDGRSALMHNKFIIIDSALVWTGSMNLTINGSYRNNNNLLSIRNQRMVENYQAEFDEMFVQRAFGPRSPRNTPHPRVTIDGIPVEVYFAPEDDVVPQIVAQIAAADSSVRFMAFSFTLDAVGDAMLARANDGIFVQGLFETIGSETQFSEMTRLHCAGLPVRQDGNGFIMHHKVIIVDDDTVLIGSFNFSNSATDSNDENLVIIKDPALAALYIAEYEMLYEQGHSPEDIPCS